MGTRGLFGFYYKGFYYLCYNHWDSYPEGLGRKLVAEIMKADIVEWFGKFLKLRFICSKDKTTEQDVMRLEKWTDLTVDDRSTDNWYCLLRGCQGSFEQVLESGYMLIRDGGKFKDPSEWGDIFTEWVYVLNFDTYEFEWYRGTQKCWQIRLDCLPEGLFTGSCDSPPKLEGEFVKWKGENS